MANTSSTTIELAKVAAQLVTPAVAVLIALWLRPALGRVEKGLWAQQKLIEKRIAVFEGVAAALDDIFCFFMYREHWNQIDPSKIVEHARKTSATIRVNAPFFSEVFGRAYREFHTCCFHAEQDGRLQLRTRTDDRRRSTEEDLSPEMRQLFVDETGTCPVADEVSRHYQALMKAFRDDIGLPSWSEAQPKGGELSQVSADRQ